MEHGLGDWIPNGVVFYVMWVLALKTHQRLVWSPQNLFHSISRMTLHPSTLCCLCFLPWYCAQELPTWLPWFFFSLRLPTLPRNISSRDVIDQIHCLASELIKLTVVLVGEAFQGEEIWRPCEKEKKLQWYPKLLENSIAMSYEEYVKRKRQKTNKQKKQIHKALFKCTRTYTGLRHSLRLLQIHPALHSESLLKASIPHHKTLTHAFSDAIVLKLLLHVK